MNDNTLPLFWVFWQQSKQWRNSILAFQRPRICWEQQPHSMGILSHKYLVRSYLRSPRNRSFRTKKFQQVWSLIFFHEVLSLIPLFMFTRHVTSVILAVVFGYHWKMGCRYQVAAGFTSCKCHDSRRSQQLGSIGKLTGPWGFPLHHPLPLLASD